MMHIFYRCPKCLKWVLRQEDETLPRSENKNYCHSSEKLFCPYCYEEVIWEYPYRDSINVTEEEWDKLFLEEIDNKKTGSTTYNLQLTYASRNPLFDKATFLQRKQKEAEERKQAIEASKVHCPYCNSTDVQKIRGVDRMFSIGLLGIASGKMGKQWHCNKCRSDF